MKILLVVLFSAVCASTVVFSDEIDGDPDLAAYLREAIENFRDQMTKGIPEIKLPVLDPLVLRDLNINVKENVADINLLMKELNVRELSKFTIHKLVPDFAEFYLKVNLSLPALNADGNYKVSGKILKIFPIYGDGIFQINASEPRLEGEGKLEPMDDTLQMTSLNLDLQWHDLSVYLQNFLGGGKFSEVLQEILPKLGKGAFDEFKPKILLLADKALMNELNKVLRRPEVKNIIKGLIPG